MSVRRCPGTKQGMLLGVIIMGKMTGQAWGGMGGGRLQNPQMDLHHIRVGVRPGGNWRSVGGTGQGHRKNRASPDSGTLMASPQPRHGSLLPFSS